MSEQRRSREMMKSNFVNRVKDNQQRSEGGGGSYFKSNLPTGVKFWKCTNGAHQIDIIPYFAGARDPLVALGKMKEGEEQYVLEFYVHGDVGVSDGGIMCLSKTYGKPCPICEDYKRKTQEGYDDKILTKLRPKSNPRSVYNIIDIDNESKGIQVWHTSHYLMEKYLLELAKIPVRPGQKNIDPVVAFMDPSEGKTIAFKREGEKENTKFIGHRFVDRPVDFIIPNELLNDAWTLDDFLCIPTYDEVCEYYYGRDGKDNTEQEEQPSRGRGRGVETEEKGSRGDNERTEPTERTSRRGAEQEEPVGRRGRVQEEEKRTETNSSNPCPHGHKFGLEVDKFLDDCEKCDSWKVCAREKERLKSAPAAEETKTENKSVEPESTSRRSRREEAANPSETKEEPPVTTRRSRRA